ncbi:Quinone oxidoreductase 1 [Acaryochloris thomasi RCC1774]|uniref:Quinone oxidoreductase 1 n=1 Tax=Acaryochloris thomasi RCC1774 TaxID=1764569 RepID=A0A2W1JQT1_9CYAN|nr:zinc-dependent alcohol dehydrogenase family protein [Acaryochloris thomasi]PZD73222.1 Quinone oxidoreductase 1 [Acaryochloris thomasi RCC1774]
MARIVRIHEFGGPEVLKIDDQELPEPSKGEVRISVKAVGLNRADALWRLNQYIEVPKLPCKLGYDAAGTVEAVGSGVDNVAVGDRIFTIPAFSQGDYGVYGEAAIVPANAIWPWPERLSAEEAACVGVQYTTVYFALSTIGEVGEGDTVLLTAATGGVGFAGIEVAKQLGASVIATTRKRAKAAALSEAGADHVIVTDEEDLATRIEEITGGKGVKIVFDPIAGKSIPTLLNSLAVGGRYVLYGVLDQTDPVLPAMSVLAKNISLHGYSVFAYTGYPHMGMPQQVEAVAEAREFLLPRLADGRLKPVVSETFKLDDVVAAHQSLESNKQTGKIVLQVS